MKKLFLGLTVAGLIIMNLFVSAEEITLYENDFENPNGGNCDMTKFSDAFNVEDFSYYQLYTADCKKVDPYYSDPIGSAGEYFGGIVDSQDPEAWGLLLTHYDQKYINIAIDQALVALYVEGSSSFGFYSPKKDQNVTFSFYQIKTGENISLEFAGIGYPANVLVGGDIYDSFYSTGVVVSLSGGPNNQLNRETYHLGVELPKKTSIDDYEILMVMSVVSDNNQAQMSQYVAFDNLKITAADYSIEEPITNYTIQHLVEDVQGAFHVQTGDTVMGTGNVDTLITGDILTYTGYTYDPSISTQTGTLLSGEELTLSLYYPIDRFTLDFIENGGSEVSTQTGIAYNSTGLEPIVPQRDGHIFRGWYLDDVTFADLYDFSTPLTGDVTLYAQWTPKPVKIKKVTGGSGGSSHTPSAPQYDPEPEPISTGNLDPVPTSVHHAPEEKITQITKKTQEFMCEILVQEDNKANYSYKDTDYTNFRMTDVQKTEYADEVESMYHHCLMHGIDNSITYYGVTRPLTYGESYKLFARLLLLSYADYSVEDGQHWSLAYQLAGRAKQLWTWSSDINPDMPINMKHFLDVFLMILDDIDDNHKTINTDAFDGKVIRRGEASMFIEVLIEKVYEHK